MTEQSAPLEPSAGQPENSADLPWYVALLYGIGGWFAGLFLSAFVVTALEGLVGRSLHDGVFVVVGIAMLGAALVLLRRSARPFLRQFTNAIAVGGHAVVVYGAFDLLDWSARYGWLFSDFTLVVLVSFGVVVVLYIFYPDQIHRFVTIVWTAALLTVWTLVEFEHVQNAVHGVLLVEAVLLAILFGRGHPAGAARPLAFGVTIGVLLTPMLILLPGDWVTLTWWPAQLVATALLLILIWFLYRASTIFRGPFVAVAVVLCIAIGGLTTPGLTVALAILVIGLWRDEPVLRIIGTLFVPIYLIVFYYDLDIGLLSKSLMLIAGGVVFIAARYALDRFGPRLNEMPAEA